MSSPVTDVEPSYPPQVRHLTTLRVAAVARAEDAVVAVVVVVEGVGEVEGEDVAGVAVAMVEREVVETVPRGTELTRTRTRPGTQTIIVRVDTTRS